MSSSHLSPERRLTTNRTAELQGSNNGMDKEKNTSALIAIFYTAFGLIAGFVTGAFAIDELHAVGEPTLRPHFVSDSWWIAFLMFQWVCVVAICVVLFYRIGRFLAQQAVRSNRRVIWLLSHLAISAILMTSLAACVERWKITNWILGMALGISANWGMVVILRRGGVV